ncbi:MULTISPECIES: antitoxin [Caproicibacterium]|uniref:Antitoxin n=1 Tax=Caproicibacterium argilliputei TaxID=3030016 RepID=A0AA97D661_9FIRM|nr:antitoxin [Caproicibacterium argilliputei]WOC31295.1 antitoxin [Caproicibacterium argilliputei]
MADILKITSPVVDKNQQTQVRPGSAAEAAAPFQMQDVAKIAQTTAQTGILKQNTGLVKEGSPNILENLLKDPSVTETYLKNIFMLEEIYKLLPANNRTVTDEIERLFELMLLKPGQVAQEMKAQEQVSTSFRGELFTLLRQVSNSYGSNSEIQPAIANLLRALNHHIGNQDIRDAVANSFTYLADRLSSSKNLAPRLQELAQRFRAPDAEQNFQQLKQEALSLLQNVRNSVLFSQDLEKVVSITVYNLSRHNSNKQFLQESAVEVWRLLDFQSRGEFKALLAEYLQAADEGKEKADEGSTSKVMDTLVKLLSGEVQGKISPAEQERMEKIIRSLLSSPSNFTPLLHFVLPLAYQDLHSFAEVWIDPQSQDRGERQDEEKGIHVLLVIDVEAFGRFEAEVYERNREVDFTLYCPPALVEAYQDFGRTVAQILRPTSYYAGNIQIKELKSSRSLMQVFKTLPYRRTGVDVKI